MRGTSLTTKQAIPLAGELTLHRLAIIRLHPATRTSAFGAEVGGVRLETLATEVGDDSVRRMVIGANIELAVPPKLAQGRFVVVPSKPRAQVEAVVESVANMVALVDRCKRTISSTVPCVAFKATTPAAQTWLDGAVGIHEQNELKDIPSATSLFDFDQQILNQLLDRLDGVALFSEALAQDHVVGKFREFVRVLERAFALPARQLPAPLLKLLDLRFGYTLDEIETWARLRDSASHADVRKAFALEPDVRPFVDRLEQAALDVVLNKAQWRDSSSNRRSVWSPNHWTSSANGDVTMKRSTEGVLGAQLLDQFGIYPVDMETVVALPEGWWSPPAPAGTGPRKLEVIE